MIIAIPGLSLFLEILCSYSRIIPISKFVHLELAKYIKTTLTSEIIPNQSETALTFHSRSTYLLRKRVQLHVSKGI